MVYSKRTQYVQLPEDKYCEKEKVVLDHLIKTGLFTDEQLDQELFTLAIGVSKLINRFLYSLLLFYEGN